jgi:hypothetical protein
VIQNDLALTAIEVSTLVTPAWALLSTMGMLPESKANHPPAAAPTAHSSTTATTKK